MRNTDRTSWVLWTQSSSIWTRWNSCWKDSLVEVTTDQQIMVVPYWTPKSLLIIAMICGPLQQAEPDVAELLAVMEALLMSEAAWTAGLVVESSSRNAVSWMKSYIGVDRSLILECLPFGQWLNGLAKLKSSEEFTWTLVLFLCSLPVPASHLHPKRGGGGGKSCACSIWP